MKHQSHDEGAVFGYLNSWSVCHGDDVVVHAAGTGAHATLAVRRLRSVPGVAGPASAVSQPEALPCMEIPVAGWRDCRGSSIYFETDEWSTATSFSVELSFRTTGAKLSGGRPLVVPESGNWSLYITPHAELQLYGDADSVGTVSLEDPEGWYTCRLEIDGARARLTARSCPGPFQGSTAVPHTGAPVGGGLSIGRHLEVRGPSFNGRVSGIRVWWTTTDDVTKSASFGISPAGLETAKCSPGSTVLAKLHNVPTLAVRGPIDSDGGCQLDAVHLHDDDLEDACFPAVARIRVPETLGHGMFAVELRGANGQRAELPFVVRRPMRAAPVVVLLPTFTYMAYANEQLPTAGHYAAGRRDAVALNAVDREITAHPEFGISLYDRHSDSSGCTIASRRRPIFNHRSDYRPSLLGFGRNLTSDLRLLSWLEHAGVDFDIVTDEDVHDEGPEALRGARLLVTGSHPEYVSADVRNAALTFVRAGGNIFYAGGNGFYMRVGRDPRRPHLIECRRGDSGGAPWDSEPGETTQQLDGEQGGRWRALGKPPSELLGVEYIAMGLVARPYRRTAASYDADHSWVFAGVSDETFGAQGLDLGAAGGYEVDWHEPALGHSDAVVLASAVLPGDVMRDHRPVWLSGRPLRADLVRFRHTGGGEVFSVGSMTWAGSLVSENYNNDVATISQNIVEHLTADVRSTVG